MLGVIRLIFMKFKKLHALDVVSLASARLGKHAYNAYKKSGSRLGEKLPN